MITSPLRYLLDEHYPPTLAAMLIERAVDAVALLQTHPELLGAEDTMVLRTAAEQGWVVVTEDVTTFPAAINAVPEHVGVVYCRSAVFQRTAAGLPRLTAALVALTEDPPPGLGNTPVTWWLEPAISP